MLLFLTVLLLVVNGQDVLKELVSCKPCELKDNQDMRPITVQVGKRTDFLLGEHLEVFLGSRRVLKP